MNNISMIPVRELIHHPENPRKDLGDLTLEQVEAEAEELGIIFEFLLNTKELTLEEYNDLCNMVGELADAARKALE